MDDRTLSKYGDSDRHQKSRHHNTTSSSEYQTKSKSKRSRSRSNSFDDSLSTNRKHSHSSNKRYDDILDEQHKKPSANGHNNYEQKKPKLANRTKSPTRSAVGNISSSPQSSNEK
jgi:hypothetical protein